MKRKVEGEEYASAQEFADDLSKMFDHTEMYFLVSTRVLEKGFRYFKMLFFS